MQAVNNADVAVVRALLAAGAEPDPRLGDQSTPLHEAGFANTYDERDAELVEALIDGGADPDARDGRRQTPLHNGVLSANVLGIEALLERGADPCLRNDAGQTPGGTGVQRRNRGPVRGLPRLTSQGAQRVRSRAAATEASS